MTKIKSFISILLILCLVGLGFSVFSKLFNVFNSNTFVLFSINDEYYSQNIDTYTFKQGDTYEIKVFVSNSDSSVLIEIVPNEGADFSYQVNDSETCFFLDLKSVSCCSKEPISGGYKLFDFKTIQNVLEDSYPSGTIISNVPTDCTTKYYRLNLYINESKIISFSFDIEVHANNVEFGLDSIVFN